MNATRTRKRKPPEIVVRGLEPRDVDAWARIQASPEVFPALLRAPFGSRAALARELEGLPDAVHLLVAEVDGEVVGVGSLRLDERPRRRHAAALGLFVDGAWLGGGVGAALLDALLELGARWSHVLRFELEVWVDEEAAIALYRSRGFAVEGVLRGYGLRGGRLVDAFAMGRLAERLPYERLIAEQATKRRPPALPPGKASTPPPPPANGNGNGHGRSWVWGTPPSDDDD